MSTWTNVTIPTEASPNYVLVKNISLQSSEDTVREFFLFCGKIKEFEINKDTDGEHQIAVINFERESAAKTATLLSNALIDDCHIQVAPYFSQTVPEKEETEEKQEEAKTQEGKPKSRIAAEILANGYLLQDQVVAKGLEYDNKYGLSTRLGGYLSMFQNNVKQFDEKYRVWDKAMDLNQKYAIQEKVQAAAQTAQSTAQNALQSPTGQKARGFAEQTLAQIAAVHYEARQIKTERGIQSPKSTEKPAAAAAETTTPAPEAPTAEAQ